MHAILMVKHDAQIAYADQYAEGFRNSYSALWEAFGAQEIEHRDAYLMPIPPKLKPLAGVKHKGRAIARRRNWLEIALSARQAMLVDRVSLAPPPIEGDTQAVQQTSHLTDSQKAPGEVATELVYAEYALQKHDASRSSSARFRSTPQR